MSDGESSFSETLSNYATVARKAMRYWPRAVVAFIVVVGAGMAWVLKRPRIYKSEASATVIDTARSSDQGLAPDEAQAALRARLDQVYGSRANLGAVLDELHLYPWLSGQTSRLRVIESFQEAITYTAAGRDAFHLEVVYRDPYVAQRAVRRLLRLYTDERRSAGQELIRAELGSVQTALGGLETVLTDQEDHMERFERANHALVEQVRYLRLGQTIRPMPGASSTASTEPVASQPGDSPRTHHLRIRLGALQSRFASLQRSITPAANAQPAAPSGPVEESERVQTMRHAVSELRDRLARLRTTYTEEYPDVQVAVRRLSEAERDLNGALAAERARNATTAVAPTAPPEQVRLQIESVSREIDDTRAALSAAVREDRARSPATLATPTRATPRDANTPVVENAPVGADRPLGSLVEVESMWDRLTAELTTTRTRYQQVLSRKFELEAQLATVNANGADVLRIIDPPSLPAEPEPPGRTKLSLIVLALALALALGVAGLSGFLDARVYEPADLRRWGELPELPAIPDIHELRAIVPGGTTRRSTHHDLD
jgi:uncharacterized protein involved in exopolysaccharide biosynthesis